MWHMEKLPARGGMLGSTTPNTFEGHRFETEEDLLVREATQNAKDQKSTTKIKPKIVIREITLSGARKRDFLKAARLGDLFQNSDLLKKTQDFSELRTIGSDKPLGLLYVEDFNTTGLDGPIDDPEKNWMRFNLHGDAAKLEEESKIGSYGYGKSVLSRAAGTNTFIVYTVIKARRPTDDQARLMGHTFQPWFHTRDGNKSGRGWLCARVDGKDDPIPYRNQHASELAAALGFAPRKADETGTSFLLIGTSPGRRHLSIDAIRRAFETWWWPAILDDKLDVELWKNGSRVQGPSPRLRKDLQPYIACKARLGTGIGDEVSDMSFERIQGKKLGRLGLIVAPDESIFDQHRHPKAPGPRRVARTRAESGMITEYKEFGTAKRVSFVGFFSCATDVDDILKRSEPPTHDEWSSVSQRLAKVKGGADIVQAIEDRTYHNCLRFQRSNSAMRAPLSNRLPVLEELLGSAFDEHDEGTPKKKKGDGPSKYPRKMKVEYPESSNGAPAPRFEKSQNHFDFLVRYSLRSEIDVRTKVNAWFEINVAEDVQMKKGKAIVFDVFDQASGKKIFSGTQPHFPVELSPGQSKIFRLKSAPYPRHQVVILQEGEEKHGD